MSRHHLPPRAGYEHHEITVGWDRSLGSFFAQAYATGDGPAEEEAIHLWLGADEPITEAATVVEAVRPYAHVPEHLIAQLKADSAREGSRRKPGTRVPAIDAVLDQLESTLHKGTAEQATTLIERLLEEGLQPLVERVLTALLDQEIRSLSDRQLTEAHGAGHTIYGLAIIAPDRMHVAILDAEQAVLCVARESTIGPRTLLAVLGYGPDRYTYRAYPGAGPAELFSLTPIGATR